MGKNVQDCISTIERELAQLKSFHGGGGEAEMEGEEPEVSTKTVGRGRKQRQEPFFKKKKGGDVTDEGDSY